MRKRLFSYLLAAALLLTLVPVGARAADCLYGDVNGDGKINAKDATLILRYAVGKLTDLSEYDWEAANVNADDRVNAKDATLILRYSVHKLDKFPADTHEHDYEYEITTPPTCSYGGEATYTCACGDSYKETVPKNEHEWSDWVVTREPTTESVGFEARTCSKCHGAQERPIDKLPADDSCEHEWSNWTCDTNGSYGSCTNCGQSITVDGSTATASRQVVDLINEYRATKNLPALTYASSAEMAARIRAAELTVSFGHKRPDGSHNSTVLDAYGMWGECCAAGYGSAETAVNAWITSSSHEPSLSATHFTTATAAYVGGYWVVIFG